MVRTEIVGILIRGAFGRELRLKFSNGVVTIRTPMDRDAREYSFALQMLDRFQIGAAKPSAQGAWGPAPDLRSSNLPCNRS